MMSTQWSASSELDQTMCRAVLINLGTSHFAQLNFLEARGAYHLTENVGNSGWKVNGKVTFRKFQPKIEEYVLR